MDNTSMFALTKPDEVVIDSWLLSGRRCACDDHNNIVCLYHSKEHPNNYTEDPDSKVHEVVLSIEKQVKDKIKTVSHSEGYVEVYLFGNPNSDITSRALKHYIENAREWLAFSIIPEHKGHPMRLRLHFLEENPELYDYWDFI